MKNISLVLVSNVAFVLALIGCSDSSPTLGSLTGTVTDSQGTPIAGAIINLGYTVRWNGVILTTPPSSPAPVPESLGHDGWPGIWIRDHRNRLVWVRTESDQLGWSGIDLNGDPVPDGPYHFLIAWFTDGHPTRVNDFWDILSRRTMSERSLVAQATSDDLGNFVIPYPDLPIWKSYPFVIYDKSDTPVTDDAIYDHTVEVYAFRGDGTTAHGQETVTVDSEYESVHVDLVIP